MKKTLPLVTIFGFTVAMATMSFPSFAMAATTPSNTYANVSLRTLLPGQTVKGNVPGQSGTTYSIHRLTSLQVAKDEKHGLISTPVNTMTSTAASSGCWIYLSPTIKKTTTYTGSNVAGSYTTEDYIVFRFWYGSGSNPDVVTTASPSSDAAYPFNTTNPASVNISGSLANEVAYFNFFQSPYGTYKDFDTYLNAQTVGAGINWSYQDGLNANKNSSGSFAFNGPWLCN